MRTILSICLAGVAALALASCACPRCGGLGTEVAQTSGKHTYPPHKYYKRGQTIACLSCNGTGNYGNNPNAGAFSGPAAFQEVSRTEKGQKGAGVQIHTHTHYNTYRPAVYVW